jgi:ribosomal protein S30
MNRCSWVYFTGKLKAQGSKLIGKAKSKKIKAQSSKLKAKRKKNLLRFYNP